jgi:tRNA(His) 5'-end guanylyltransferase
MDSRRFEVLQRDREWFHGLRLLQGAWSVVRVDGRGFTRFTEGVFDKPFDEELSRCMIAAADALIVELGGRYAFTASDEISVLLAPSWDLFDRSLEKLVSVSAGIASATFTHSCGKPAHFDGRAWLGTSTDDVVDYFSWRQADATRCALNGWCYWTLRSEGAAPAEATGALNGASVAAKNQMLFERGVNFDEVPAWQRRGVGIWWETFAKSTVSPLTGADVPAERRRLRHEAQLPMKDDYRALVRGLVEP